MAASCRLRFLNEGRMDLFCIVLLLPLEELILYFYLRVEQRILPALLSWFQFVVFPLVYLVVLLFNLPCVFYSLLSCLRSCLFVLVFPCDLCIFLASSVFVACLD